MLIEIVRLSTEETCIRGAVKVEGMPVAVSLELPWRDNRPRVSCIPEGRYSCSWYLSPLHGETLLVSGVPDRSYILFHGGNTFADTNGCILVGEAFGTINGVAAIFRSQVGLGKFKQLLLGKNDFNLIVRSA